MTTTNIISGNIWANYDSEKVQTVLMTKVDPERKAWFETQGITLENCQSLDSALKLSGMDFEVKKKPIYFNSSWEEVKEGEEKKKNSPPKFVKVPNAFMTVRTDTMVPFGVVSDAYEILQNKEAFDFMDSLCVNGAKFETAGFFRKNQSAGYITMSTEPLQICGDDFVDYLMISNGHDGKWGLKVCLTPIRAICKNSAMIAMKKAKLAVNIKHTKNLVANMENAKQILLANTNYMKELKKLGESLAVEPFSREAFEALAKKLYPIKEDMGQRVVVNNIAQVEYLLNAYNRDDLNNFRETKWGAIQAIADVESHPIHFKKTKEVTYNGSQEFQNVVLFNMPLLNKVVEMLKESV